MPRKAKKKKPVYMTIRKFWTRNPTTRVKQDSKKETIKKSCRTKAAKKTDE